MKHRLLTGLLAGAAALTLAVSTVAPAAAGSTTPNRGRYAALGDSYAAGVGNTPLRGAGDSGRSSEAYPVLLAAAANKVTFLAESGATTMDVLMEQVPMVPAGARQITLTVGGNDVGFMAVAQTCAERPLSCAAAISAAAAKLAPMGESLGQLIVAIKAQAPNATIYVTGYPRLFQPSPIVWAACPSLPSIPAQALYAADAAVEHPDPAVPSLNSVIRGAALATGAVYVDVDVPEGICTAPNRYIFIASGVSLHPTPAGQQVYAEAIESAGFTTG